MSAVPTRYAVRQVLDQEHRKAVQKLAMASRQARFAASNPTESQDEGKFTFKNKATVDSLMKRVEGGDDESGKKVKRDFFGRVVVQTSSQVVRETKRVKAEKGGKVWVTYHEGFSNAVRKPITVKELMRGL